LIVPQCAKCADRKCIRETWKEAELPEFCPMKHKGDVIEAAMEKYDKGETQLYYNSTVTEQRAYQNVRGRVMAVRPRLLEIIKLGAVDKTEWRIEGKDKIVALRGDPEGFEAGCNPIVQAEILKSEDTDLNIIVGLCIGHDIQFTSNSATPVTTLIVKDRLTGHNPFSTLYSGYHHPRLWKEEDIDG
jgi:hypothetical protein